MTRSAAVFDLWAAGREAWPSLPLAEDTFTEWLLDRLDADTDPASLVGPDLFLVCGCLTGLPGAADAFVSGPLARAARQATRMTDREAVADLLQDLALQMLTPAPDGAPPKLAQYSGRGALLVWLRMAVTRRALNAGRGAGRTVSFDQIDWDKAGTHDPERSALRRIDAAEVASIFAAAAEATPAEDRTLLRLHYLHGSTLTELAALHHTSRSAIHRRVEAAREAMWGRVRDGLRARLSTSDSECRSLMLLFQSQFRDHLGGVLRGADGPAQLS